MQDDQLSNEPTHPLIEQARQRRLARAQRWRTAEHHAGYLLPYLKPGMDLLDVGCGAGSITRGLAACVAPSRTLGIDLLRASLPESLDAPAEGVPSFAVADVRRLPFPDDSFDAAHAHALFQHLDDPLGAMRELHRVLRPGGVLGVADWDLELALPHPGPELLVRSLEWFCALRVQAHGDPRAGRKLAEGMARAGFARPAMTVVAEGLASRSTARQTGEHWAAMFEDAQTRERLLDAGHATRVELDAMPDAWRAWGHTPGAIMVAHWFCAVGWKQG